MLFSKIPVKWPKFYAMLVFILASSFTIYEFALRVMPSAMTLELMQSFNIRASGLGMMASLFYYGYSPMQIPAGLLYDRIGPRKLLSISTFLCAISGIVFGMADNIWLASFARFLTGFTASFAFIGALLIAARWFAPQRFAFFTGLVQFLGCVGAIIGEAPIAATVDHIGWRNTATLFALAGIVLSLLMYAIVRDYPKDHNAEEKPASLPHISIWAGLKRICHNSQTWWVALYGFCCWAPISIFATLWGPSFLAELKNVPMTTATAMTSTVWLAIGLGSPLAGWWSNHIQRRCTPLALFSVIGLVSSLLIIYQPLSHLLLLAMLFLFGLSASSQVITFGLVLDNNTDNVMGTAAGFNNMAVIAGGLILQPLVGFIIHHYWSLQPMYHHDTPIYSLHEYRMALTIIPACFIVGLLTSLLAIKETRCQRLSTSSINQ